MARITRKELKTDKFALEVEHTVDFFEEHRQEILRYCVIALVVVALGAAVYFYRKHQHSVREQDLAEAIQAQEAPVGAAAAAGTVSFPTQEAKEKEETRLFTNLVTKYPGTGEGLIAEYYLGSLEADQGKMADAEKRFQKVAGSGDTQFASLAKLALAQIDYARGRGGEGEKLLRSLIEHPTTFVSKEQATIALARELAKTKPEEARKLLEPLIPLPRSAVSQAAIQAYGELPKR